MILFNHNKSYGDTIMKFKAAFVNLLYQQKLSSLVKTGIQKDDFVQSYKFFEQGNVLIAKIRKSENSAEYGAEANDGDLRQLSEVIGSEKISKIKFIVVNLSNNSIYFESSLNDAKKLVSLFFNISDNVEIYQTVDMNELKSIAKLKVTTMKSCQVSLFDDEYGQTMLNSIYRIFPHNSMDEESLEFKFMKDSHFNKQELEKFINDCTLKGKVIFMKGLNVNGDTVVFNPSGNSKKSFEIDVSASQFNDLRDISEEEIYNKMKERW